MPAHLLLPAALSMKAKTAPALHGFINLLSEAAVTPYLLFRGTTIMQEEEEKEEDCLIQFFLEYSHMMIRLLLLRRRLETRRLTAASCSAFWLVTPALVGG